MRIMVTGASGFVGSHTVAALLAAGHRPRVLVRDPGKATKVLAALGVPADSVEFVPGDMLDEAAVEEALTGCDAAIHTAAAIGITGPAGDLVDINVTGTRNVVGGAAARGLDPIVYISSVGVFVPPDRPVITVDGPLARPRTGYGRSKVTAEQYVRDLQDSGASITTVYPGGICGPDQPVLGELNEGLVGGISKAWPYPNGGVSVLDVRDLALAITCGLTPGQGPRRRILGGHFLTWAELIDLCEELTGVPIRRMKVPGWIMLALGSALDAAKRIKHFEFPLTRDAAEFMIKLVPTDDRPLLDETGLTLRPARETLADSLRWLVAAGHLDPAKAGRLIEGAR
jgi:nucleoside-diphosphate-sugar epimerase